VRVLLGRRQVYAAVTSIVLLACVTPVLGAATAATGKDRLASAIEKRLNALGDLTSPMTASAGYFYRNPILPQRAFQTTAGCGQKFLFSVSVYKTKAQAVTMYDYFYQHVLNIGGNFSDFNMVRRGRVIYTADTASAPNQHAPAVPTRDFHSLAEEVSAPLAAHPRGCRPEL
jgi:hypothetical protein